VGNITDSGKKVANDPNKYLKDAVSIINDRIGLLIQSGSTECISASIDYLLTAFYFVRDRLIELSNNPARFEETLSIFRTLLDDAAATAKHKTTGYSWLGVIKVIRDFRVVRRFLFYKYEKPKQYWVPVAALGVSFLSLRAMAQVANKGKAFDQALNKFREPTLEYWNKYEKADSSTRAMHEGREEVVKRKGEGSKGKKGLSEDRFVLTLVKATYLITAVHDSPVHVLISRMDQIIEWLNSGAEPDHDTWSVLRAVKDIL
jgi:hypothetical protein